MLFTHLHKVRAVFDALARVFERLVIAFQKKVAGGSVAVAHSDAVHLARRIERNRLRVALRSGVKVFLLEGCVALGLCRQRLQVRGWKMSAPARGV